MKPRSTSSTAASIETRPDPMMLVKYPMAESTHEPNATSSSNSDLINLNLMATKFVRSNEEPYDLVGELNRSKDLVEACNKTDLIGSVGIETDPIGALAIETSTVVLRDEAAVKLPNPVASEGQNSNGAEDDAHRHVKSSSSSSAKKTKHHETFVKDQGKSTTTKSQWWKPCVTVRIRGRSDIGTAPRYDGGHQRKGGGRKEAWSRRLAKWRRQGAAKQEMRERNSNNAVSPLKNSSGDAHKVRDYNEPVDGIADGGQDKFPYFYPF